MKVFRYLASGTVLALGALGVNPKKLYFQFGRKEGRGHKQVLKKTDIVDTLSRLLSLKSYLELCTPSTGGKFLEIRADQFKEVNRLMYLAPFSFDDGLRIDFRSPDESIDGALEEFEKSGSAVDICLVDGWHTYSTASRDIAAMYKILQDGGILVVHDCFPPDREAAQPTFRRGGWCGVNYKAFLDFVLVERTADYLTINSDYGCGVIVKNRTFEGVMEAQNRSHQLPRRPQEWIKLEFLDSKSNFDKAYEVFEKNHHELLRLIEPDNFELIFGSKY